MPGEKRKNKNGSEFSAKDKEEARPSETQKARTKEGGK